MDNQKNTPNKGFKNSIRKMLAAKSAKAEDKRAVVSLPEEDNMLEALEEPNTELPVVKGGAKNTANSQTPKTILNKSEDEIPLAWKADYFKDKRSNAGRIIKRIKEQGVLKNKERKS